MEPQSDLPSSERRAPLIPPAARERMEIELALARRAGFTAALLAVSASEPQLGDAPADLAARSLPALEERLRVWASSDAVSFLRASDVLFVLLPRRDLDAARSLAEKLIAEAKHMHLPGLERDVRVSVSIGLARDQVGKELWLEALLGVAAEGLELARSRGGECAVHTELYALCQRKAEHTSERPRVVIPPELEARVLAENPALSRPTERTPIARAAPRSLPRAAAPASAFDAPPQVGAFAASAAVPELTPGASPEEPEHLREALAARERAHREEVELLERRIAKLVSTLDETERELRDVMRRKREGDGLASIYREVQGLAAEDDRYSVKAALMERILQANLELREILRQQQRGAAG